MFYVYVLRCRDGSLYTGYTSDLDQRLRLHREGKASRYTRSRLPVAMVAQWQFENKADAMRHEKLFKSFAREEKMKLIAGSPFV